jgi:hypothetical protein
MRYASMVYSERSFQKVNTRRAWSAKAKKPPGTTKSVKEKTKQKLNNSENTEEYDLHFANHTGPADYQSNLDLTGKD